MRPPTPRSHARCLRSYLRVHRPQPEALNAADALNAAVDEMLEHKELSKPGAECDGHVQRGGEERKAETKASREGFLGVQTSAASGAFVHVFISSGSAFHFYFYELVID